MAGSHPIFFALLASGPSYALISGLHGASSHALTRRQVAVGLSFGGLHGAVARAAPVPTADVARAELVRAIESGASDELVLERLHALIPFDPSRGRGAVDGALGGTWDLLWTKDEAPAPVQVMRKTLHQPVGTQLLGDAAAPRFGAGRVAQLLDVAGVRFELSSGATPAPDDSRVLQIFPPFRFAALAAGRRFEIAEAGSDAGFRALNARTAEAQAAPRNRYTQEYLETSGRVGDLRVSRITEGDPAIVGNVYVHRRIADGSR
jgi:hypothetical protein